MAAPDNPSNGDAAEKVRRLAFAVEKIRTGTSFPWVIDLLEKGRPGLFTGVDSSTARRDARAAVDLYKAHLAEFARDNAPEAVTAYMARYEMASARALRWDDRAEDESLPWDVRLQAAKLAIQSDNVALKSRDSRSQIEALFVARVQNLPPPADDVDLSKLTAEELDQYAALTARAARPPKPTG